MIKEGHESFKQLSELRIEDLDERIEFSFCQGICYTDTGIPRSCPIIFDEV